VQCCCMLSFDLLCSSKRATAPLVRWLTKHLSLGRSPPGDWADRTTAAVQSTIENCSHGNPKPVHYYTMLQRCFVGSISRASYSCTSVSSWLTGWYVRSSRHELQRSDQSDMYTDRSAAHADAHMQPLTFAVEDVLVVAEVQH
jgi:hypothetical protein